ncbi:hypothetical protein, partial [Pseudomonas syringae group genomosp. 7]|uniref:hypothetical protein n=1 Tax=Pseudomonas syringae group genomosp. 7 TaxID=251699 RepID=UPI0037704570
GFGCGVCGVGGCVGWVGLGCGVVGGGWWWCFGGFLGVCVWVVGGGCRGGVCVGCVGWGVGVGGVIVWVCFGLLVGVCCFCWVCCWLGGLWCWGGWVVWVVVGEGLFWVLGGVVVGLVVVVGLLVLSVLGFLVGVLWVVGVGLEV